MSRYLVKLSYDEDEAFAWITPEGRQVLSRANISFSVSEDEKEILEEQFPDFLEILKKIEEE